MVILSATDAISSPICPPAWDATAHLRSGHHGSLHSQGDGTLTVVKEDSPTSFPRRADVATPGRAKTLTLDPKTNQIFLITPSTGRSSRTAQPALCLQEPRTGCVALAADDSALLPDPRSRQMIHEAKARLIVK